jgi:hypothetical protein
MLKSYVQQGEFFVLCDVTEILIYIARWNVSISVPTAGILLH